jgi:hypothetical protein
LGKFCFPFYQCRKPHGIHTNRHGSSSQCDLLEGSEAVDKGAGHVADVLAGLQDGVQVVRRPHVHDKVPAVRFHPP